MIDTEGCIGFPVDDVDFCSKDSQIKKLILIAAIGMTATNAMAISRYDASSMSCASVHQKIAQEGAVVLQYPSHKPGLMMYNRYVSNSMMCIGQGSTASTKVSTSDDPSCKVVTCSNANGKGPNKNHH